jgi:AAA domain, putative AbiEii toxin, Type IV TA system
LQKEASSTTLDIFIVACNQVAPTHLRYKGIGSMHQMVLSIENFGPIRRVEVPFGDITVLVGPQATGKSLVLQWLKLAVDSNRILGTLSTHGFDVARDPSLLVGWLFGAGYKHTIAANTSVRFGTNDINIKEIAQYRKRYEAHEALFVPAHRALVFSTGWPLPYRSFDENTPFVVRDFSERVRELLSRRDEGVVFPAPRRFRMEFRTILDDSLFHGGKIVVDPQGLRGEQLRLVHGETKLATMEWTTGQREVVPLLIDLLSVLPAGKIERRAPIQWVIVEEPELGLHPDGILAILTLLFEVSRRGYNLVLSTHSPLILDVLWAMRHLSERQSGWKKLLGILGVRQTQFTRRFAQALLAKRQSIVHLRFSNLKVVSRDISALDPLAADPDEAGWGGLLNHNTAIANAIAENP